ncbi:MAG: DnaJ family molecular chaperone [Saprospiraceae bacterium]
MFSEKDKAAIEKYFGVRLEDLDLEKLKKLQRELRAKYHPDNFEKFEDETVREMATERFQLIEDLAVKIETYLSGKSANSGFTRADGEDFMNTHAVFSANQLKIEVITTDKDLKYQLFGTSYRWLQFGDKYKIPDTQASIIIDEDHMGRSIGYQESIRMYLTFGENDSIDKMVEWLYPRIKDKAKSLLISGERVEIEPFSIFYAIRKKAFLRVELPAAS